VVFEWDDLGADHIISDMCQSHDCRDQLDILHLVNPAFRCTLFAIPGEMTQELLNWCQANRSWIELAVHGFYHSSNYECADMSYEEFNDYMFEFSAMIDNYFVKGFRAPGWQISDACFQWLYHNGWWVADQSYNDHRRPSMKAWVNDNNQFKIWLPNDDAVRLVDAYHGHTWNVGWNGIYEDIEKVSALVANAPEFKFVSELIV
jgi:hypothetical protein